MTMEIEDGNRTITISGEIERAYKALAAFELENNRPDPNRSPQQRRIDAMERALAAASHADATPVASGPLTYDWNGHTDIPVGRPDLSDFEVAVKVRMLMRDQLDHEAICELARDRIMGLSKRVAALSAPATPPPAGSVTDEMVERALDAYFNDPDWRKGPHAEFINDGARAGMRAALTAAIAPSGQAVEEFTYNGEGYSPTGRTGTIANPAPSGQAVAWGFYYDDGSGWKHMVCLQKPTHWNGYPVKDIVPLYAHPVQPEWREPTHRHNNLTEAERHLLLRMLAVFELSHVGQAATPELARDLREANRLVGRLALDFSPASSDEG